MVTPQTLTEPKKLCIINVLQEMICNTFVRIKQTRTALAEHIMAIIGMTMTPYTYLIGWTYLDRWYYGVQYSNNCHPSHLMVSYFTSSKSIAEIIVDNGLPDVVMVRKTFNDINKARDWEHTVLRRLNVINSLKWINQTDNVSFPVFSGHSHHNYGRKGDLHPLTGKSRPEISTSRKEKQCWVGTDNPMYDSVQKEKSIAARSGNAHHMKRKDVKEKVSGTNNWIFQSPEALAQRQDQFRQMNIARRGMKYEKIPCPVCQINMPKNNFKRHVKICELKHS
jgi:hypothetical protein